MEPWHAVGWTIPTAWPVDAVGWTIPTAWPVDAVGWTIPRAWLVDAAGARYGTAEPGIYEVAGTIVGERSDFPCGYTISISHILFCHLKGV